MMDAELKSKWLEALRSGRYTQGRNYLKKAGKHCCLGVLCEVMGLEERPPSYDGGPNVFASGAGLTSAHYLMEDSLAKCQINRYQQSQLADLNDIHGKSFKEIADWVAVNL